MNRLRLSLTGILVAASVWIVSANAGDREYHRAVQAGNTRAIAKYLAQATVVDARGANAKTALMIAAKAGQPGLVEALLKRGADVHAQTSNGGTPIMFAAIGGEISVIERLIAAGADVNDYGSNGWTALMISVAKGHLAATRRIIEAGADVNAQDIYLWSPLHRAAYENRPDILELLVANKQVQLNLGDEHGATALHHAAANGYIELGWRLICAGADPNQPDSYGRTAAHYAKNNGHRILSELLQHYKNGRYNSPACRL